MDDSEKDVEQLLDELHGLRRRVARLEMAKAELNRMQKALDQGWQSLRLLFEESPDVRAVVDGHGIIRYISPAIEKLSGYKPEELTGKHVFEFIHPDEVPQLLEDFSGSTQSLAQTHRREFRYLHADNSWHVLDSTSINLLDDPTVRGIVVTARDVTKRVMLEKAIKESEERYRALIESQGVGICEIDPEEEFIFANPEAHNIFGVPQGELADHNLREFMDADSFAMIRQQTETRKAGTKSTYDMAIIRPSGERRILRVTATPRMDEAGNMVAALSVFSDITAVKRAEEARKQSERYYGSLIRNAGDMIAVLNSDLTFRWGSRAHRRTTGYRPSKVYGRSFLDYIHPDDLEEMKKILDRIMEIHGSSLDTEARFRHSDGSYHFHAMIVTNLLADPAVHGLVINSRDVSERKKMEEELLARNEELDAFARTVAHDLRTPLSLIEGYAQLLESGDNTEEEKQRYLRNIVTAVEHMDEMTESLLQYAQVGHSSGEVSPVDSKEVVQEVLLEHGEALKGEDIEIRIEGELPVVLVDGAKLWQVFANLVDNAIKYKGDNEGPRIEIGTRPDDGGVVFYVKDNGRGIREDRKEEIFLPFRRFSGAAPRGLGIGLSTVRQAVEGWGGKVWVESAPGQGSTFLFTAPT